MTRRLRSIVAALLLVGSAGCAAASELGPFAVKSGAATVVLSYASYDPETCTYGALPRLKLVQPPAHGTIVFGKHSRDAGKVSCPAKTMTASTATYRSNGGFRGRDEMVVEAEMELFVDGTGIRSDRVHITVDVK